MYSLYQVTRHTLKSGNSRIYTSRFRFRKPSEMQEGEYIKLMPYEYALGVACENADRNIGLSLDSTLYHRFKLRQVV